MSKRKRKIEEQPQIQPQVQPQTLYTVEELSEEELFKIIRGEVDEYTKTAIEIINRVVDSDKPLRFKIADTLDFEKFLRKLDYRVRKFNKHNQEYRITYRVFQSERAIIVWKTSK